MAITIVDDAGGSLVISTLLKQFNALVTAVKPSAVSGHVASIETIVLIV